jgi:hypothetical protein
VDRWIGPSGPTDLYVVQGHYKVVETARVRGCGFVVEIEAGALHVCALFLAGKHIERV